MVVLKQPKMVVASPASSSKIHIKVGETVSAQLNLINTTKGAFFKRWKILWQLEIKIYNNYCPLYLLKGVSCRLNQISSRVSPNSWMVNQEFLAGEQCQF